MKHAFSLDLCANYAGAAWVALLQLLLVPLYVELLGIESYGLIAFCSTLFAVAQLFDLGLAPTINRELARRGHGRGDPSTRGFVRTVETIYWVVGLLIGAVIFTAAGALATRWVSVAAMPADAAAQAITLMGGVIALQWPVSCYHSALLGMHKQVTVNLLNIGTSTVFAAVVLAVLWLVSPTVDAFLVCRIAVLAGQVLLARHLTWRALPIAAGAATEALVAVDASRRPERGPGRFVAGGFQGRSVNATETSMRTDVRLRIRAPREHSRPLQPRAQPGRVRFDLATLGPVWQFTSGMMLISLTAIVLQHFDKIVLSKLLSMEMFGCYMVAASMANFVPQLVAPIYTAVFPRLTRLATSGNRTELVSVFHQTAQLIALVAQPVAITFAWFAPDIIAAWTGNPMVTAHASGVLRLLAVGALLNSVMVALYAAQLALGCTRIGVICNSVMACVLVPWALVATHSYGLYGAASAWVAVNLVYIAIGAALTFRRLLPGEAMIWVLHDVLLPITVVVSVQAAVWWLGSPYDSVAALCFKVALALVLSGVAVLAMCPGLRARMVTVAQTYLTAG